MDTKWLYSYHMYSSVNAMLQDFNWPTLQYHHQRARLSLFYKSEHNLIALETPPYYQSLTIFQTTIHLDYIINHIHPSANTNSYTYSFFRGVELSTN